MAGRCFKAGHAAGRLPEQSVQMPMLFFAACLLAMHLNMVTMVMAILAGVFVALR